MSDDHCVLPDCPWHEPAVNDAERCNHYTLHGRCRRRRHDGTSRKADHA